VTFMAWKRGLGSMCMLKDVVFEFSEIGRRRGRLVSGQTGRKCEGSRALAYVLASPSPMHKRE
jgi:hypothetical protein